MKTTQLSEHAIFYPESDHIDPEAVRSDYQDFTDDQVVYSLPTVVGQVVLKAEDEAAINSIKGTYSDRLTYEGALIRDGLSPKARTALLRLYDATYLIADADANRSGVALDIRTLWAGRFIEGEWEDWHVDADMGYPGEKWTASAGKAGSTIYAKGGFRRSQLTTAGFYLKDAHKPKVSKSLTVITFPIGAVVRHSLCTGLHGSPEDWNGRALATVISQEI